MYLIQVVEKELCLWEMNLQAGKDSQSQAQAFYKLL